MSFVPSAKWRWPLETLESVRKERDELVAALEGALGLVVSEDKLTLVEREELAGYHALVTRIKNKPATETAGRQP